VWRNQNAPLYSKSFGVDSDAAVLPGQQSEETQFLFMAHAALDVFEEKTSAAPAPGMASDLYLGLLYPTDTYQVFGYVTNTKTKLIVITDDADVKDLDVKSVRPPTFAVSCYLFGFIARLTHAFRFVPVVQALAPAVGRRRVQSVLHARRAVALDALRQGDRQARQHVLSPN
jgi:hypothetical protein